MEANFAWSHSPFANVYGSKTFVGAIHINLAKMKFLSSSVRVFESHFGDVLSNNNVPMSDISQLLKDVPTNLLASLQRDKLNLVDFLP